MHNQEIGKIGEGYAEKYLISHDYQIIKTNYHCRHGEIDIIAIDTPKRELVFTEVKTRTSSLFGEPQESVTYHKKQKILKTALHFLNSSSQKRSISWRADVIAIKLDKQRKFVNLDHFKNIFDG